MVLAGQLVERLVIEGDDTARSKLSAFGRACDQAQQSLTSKLTGATKSAGGGFLDFASKAGVVIFALKEIGQAAIGFAQSLLAPNASMEQTRIAFTHLLGSSQAAGDYLKQLWNFAASTPFNFPELANDAQQMMAFGFSAQDVIPILQDIGDAMSAMGKGQDAVAQIVMVFGQMHAAQKLNAEDMLQLTSTGIPAWKILADSMGLSVAEVQKMTTEGLIPADDAIARLRAGMHATFGGSMKDQSQTFNGLISTLQDNIQMAWMAFTGPLFEQAKSSLITLGTLVSSPTFQNFATLMGQRVGGAIQFVAQIISSQVIPAFTQFGAFIQTNVIPPVMSAITWFDNFVGHGRELQTVFVTLGIIVAGVLLPIFASLALSVAATLLPILAVVAAVGGLVAIFMHFYSTSAPFKAWVDSIVGSFMNWITSGRAVNDVMSIFHNIIAALSPAVAYLTPLFMQLGQSLIGLNVALAPLIANLGVFLTNFGQWLVQSGLLQAILTGIVIGIGLFVQGLTLLIQGLTNIITFFTTSGSNAQMLWNVLAGIGTFLATTFKPVWDQLVAVWQGQLLPALQQLQPAFSQLWTSLQGLGPTLQFIGAIVGGILVLALGLLIGAISGVLGALAGLLSGVTQMFGGIVQIISGAIQIITGIVAFLSDFITGNWGRLGADLGVIWQGILTMLAGVWNVATGLFNAAVGFIWGLISGFITGIIGFFTNLYHVLVGGSIIPDMINGIIDWFGQLPGRVGSFLLSLLSNALGILGNLVSQGISHAIDFVSGIIDQIAQTPGRVAGALSGVAGSVGSALANAANSAYTAGISIVSNIASGIINNIGSFLGNAMGSIGDFISSHLPHSPAKVGPLRDLRLQGSMITEQIGRGMLAALPQLQASLNMVLQPVSNAVALPSESPAFIGLPASSTGSSEIHVHNHIYLDSREITDMVMTRATKRIRGQGGGAVVL